MNDNTNSENKDNANPSLPEDQNPSLTNTDNNNNNICNDHQHTLLKNILNGMEALICVCDSESFDILFLNDSIRACFGIDHSGVGQKCYKVLQGLNEPCDSCPHHQIKETNNAIVWEHRERIRNRVLHKTARLIDWPGGNKAHLEYAIDITELREAQETLEHQNNLLQTVNQVSAILLQSSTDSFARNLLHSMSIMAEAAQADRVYIWKNHTRDGGLFCTQIYEWSEGAEPQQGKDLVQEVSYQEVMPSWEDTLSQGDCINGLVSTLTASEKAILSAQGILSILVVPIFLKEHFWGFVGFDDCHKERVFTEAEETILRSASELIANAFIRNNMEKNIRDLEKEADKIYYDPLTGIYNRRFLDEQLKQLMPQLSATGAVLSVLMIDIDFFKNYNDTYGHSMGDSCLKTVADTLKNTLTGMDDFVVRYGGEEFVIVLPNTYEDRGRMIADRVLTAIGQCAIPHAQNDAADHVTVSVGVATGRVEPGHSFDDYIRYADEMLYKSKQNGRNRYYFTGLPSKIPSLSERNEYARKLSNALSGITKLPTLSSGMLEDAAKIIAEIGCRTLETYRIGVWLMAKNSNYLESVAYYDASREEHSIQDDFDLSARGQYVNHLRSERLLVIPDLSQPNPLTDCIADYDSNICALLDAPIRISGELTGVVCIEQDRSDRYPGRREWTIEEQNFAGSLADLMALAITSTERR
ncbi:MAG: diguanylate cyclase [Lachnospiraceae bacterium]|jgi:diguanylate cyclase (GGDEF)-like protein|nr:diguanylate cyclase [Lachnospiraceae bacterium]